MDVDQTVNRLAVVGVMIKLFAVVAAVDPHLWLIRD